MLHPMPRPKVPRPLHQETTQPFHNLSPWSRSPCPTARGPLTHPGRRPGPTTSRSLGRGQTSKYSRSTSLGVRTSNISHVYGLRGLAAGWPGGSGLRRAAGVEGHRAEQFMSLGGLLEAQGQESGACWARQGAGGLGWLFKSSALPFPSVLVSIIHDVPGSRSSYLLGVKDAAHGMHKLDGYL